MRAQKIKTHFNTDITQTLLLHCLPCIYLYLYLVPICLFIYIFYLFTYLFCLFYLFYLLYIYLLQYNNRGLPERWTQANINPVNVTYGSLGLVGTWQQGALSEIIKYDRAGNIVKMQNSEGTPWIYSYEDKVSGK